ncbi:protein CutA isoform X2 [Puma concolor]|uniref:Protein CutA isoform X2 n=1 Tax=Puma concolor TaxID=9696 RepID=A0A6P6I132_PUMCO|nr:protein CutA isoform X2 [Puma concolor]
MSWGRASAILFGAGAALLLSLLWMPALLPVASRLLLLPRALLTMASGSPPSQPSPASSSGYVPGSVSAAFVTCPNERVAKEIARAVVEKRLAACVNLIPQITSIYEWKGELEEDNEVLMMIKTRSSLVPALTDYVQFRAPLRSGRGDRIACGAGELPIFALGAPGYRVSCGLQHSPTMMSPVPAMFPLYISMPFDLQ